MNTKDMITFESSYASDMERIRTISDLVCANYIEVMEAASDYDTFMEAGDGYISTIKKSISAIIDKIKSSFDSIIEKHKATVKKKKLDRIYTAKLSDIPKDKLDDHIEAPNMDAIMSGAKKCEQFTLKAIGQVQKQMKAVMKAKDADAIASSKEQLNSLCKSLEDKQKEIADGVMDLTKKKETFTVREAYKMAVKYKNIDEEIAGCRDRLTSAVEAFNDVINTAKSMISESAAIFEKSDDKSTNKSNVKNMSVDVTSDLWSGASEFTKNVTTTSIAINKACEAAGDVLGFVLLPVLAVGWGVYMSTIVKNF